jgi:SAM-dependent methyltransferase
MQLQLRKTGIPALGLFFAVSLCVGVLLPAPFCFGQSREAALRFQKTANTALKPVYAPLAEHIVSELDLAGKKGIGVDVGSGPGTLIIELCKRTEGMHWINAEINPYFFVQFYKAAEEAGVGHGVSAVLADAQALPFRDDYADIVVSRGSFHFWKDKRRAFSEIYRVLKPGGIAFVGRGFSPNLPVKVARKVRADQGARGGKPKYDLKETEAELRGIMKELKIREWRIRLPKPPGSEGVNYGIWLEFRKAESPKGD